MSSYDATLIASSIQAVASAIFFLAVVLAFKKMS